MQCREDRLKRKSAPLFLTQAEGCGKGALLIRNEGSYARWHEEREGMRKRRFSIERLKGCKTSFLSPADCEG